MTYNNINMKKYIIPLSIVLFASCYNDKEDQLYPSPTTGGPGGGSGGGCDTMGMTYTTNIKPIFDQSCALAGCHDASTKSSGWDLSSYSGAAATANGGRLLGSIMHQSGFSTMPKGMNKLDDCKISQIKAWVNAGAPQ